MREKCGEELRVRVVNASMHDKQGRKTVLQNTCAGSRIGRIGVLRVQATDVSMRVRQRSFSYAETVLRNLDAEFR